MGVCNDHSPHPTGLARGASRTFVPIHKQWQHENKDPRILWSPVTQQATGPGGHSWSQEGPTRVLQTPSQPSLLVVFLPPTSAPLSSNAQDTSLSESPLW